MGVLFVDRRVHAPGCSVPEVRVSVSSSGRWWVVRCPECGAVRLSPTRAIAPIVGVSQATARRDVSHRDSRVESVDIETGEITETPVAAVAS